MEYTIWCDESDKVGVKFSNFYGGVLVSSKDKDFIIDAINRKKQELNLFAEVKWTKITDNYLDKYIDLLDLFFSFVKDGRVKIRIMFTDNDLRPVGLTREQKENEFFLLYYQFIKHAFGFRNIIFPENTGIRIYFDKLPDKVEKATKFKNYIYDLNYEFFRSNLKMKKEDIAEVDSKEHVLLQCLDIVLGSMSFRLNLKHLEKPEGKRNRGKKTISKEKVYKFIHSKIKEVYGHNFNIDVNTRWVSGRKDDCWHMPYRHWVFHQKDATRC